LKKNIKTENKFSERKNDAKAPVNQPGLSGVCESRWTFTILAYVAVL